MDEKTAKNLMMISMNFAKKLAQTVRLPTSLLMIM